MLLPAVVLPRTLDNVFFFAATPTAPFIVKINAKNKYFIIFFFLAAATATATTTKIKHREEPNGVMPVGVWQKPQIYLRSY